MNVIQGGAISFEALLETGKMEQGLKTTGDLIKSFTSLTINSGDVYEDAFKKASEAVDALTNKLQTLKSQQYALQKIMDSASKWGAPNKALVGEFNKISQEIAEAERQINLYNEKLGDTKAKFDNATNAQTRFRTQVLNVKNELMQLGPRTAQNAADFDRLTKEAERLTSAIYTTNQQIKTLTSVKGATLQGLVSGLSGVSGAFTAAQGAMGLFAEKNEDLQKIMLKVQSLMSITMGLQAVSATLHQTSAFRLTVLTKAQSAYSAAVLTAGKALIKLGVSANTARIAARALYGTLTLGLGVAIPVVIGLISKYVSKQKEAKKATEEFNKAVAETSIKPISTIKQLSLAWAKLGDDIKEKEKFIDNNKDKFNSLGVSVKNVAEAEKLLIDNKKDFVEAQILKAKALAATELASEKYKNAYIKQQELEATPKEVKAVTKSVNGAPVEWEMIPNFRYQNIEKEKNKLEKEANDLFEQAAEYTEREQEILAKIGQSASNITEGSIAALEKAISELKEKYKNAGSDLERNSLAKQIREQEELLAKMDLLRSVKSKKSKESDPFLKELEEKKKAYQEYLKWINSVDESVRNAAKAQFSELLKGGGSYKEYLSSEIAALQQVQSEGKITAAQVENLRKLTTAMQSESSKTVMSEWEKNLQKQLSDSQVIMARLKTIQEMRDALKSDDPLREQKIETLGKQEEDVVKEAEKEAREALMQYTDYLDKKINLEIAYSSKISSIQKLANKAETEEEKKKINDLIALYGKMHDAHIESFAELEQVNIESIYRYGTYEQKKLQITKEYAKIIGAARAAGNEDVAKKLEGERDLEISKETKQYQEFFGDISDISIKTLENTRNVLLAMMKAAYEAGKITAEQYKQLIKEINQQADSAYKGRGIEAAFGNGKGGGFMNMMFGEGDFQSKVEGFKTMFSGAKGDMASIAGDSGEAAGNMGEAAQGAQGAAGGAASTLAIVDAIIKGVYQTLAAISSTLKTIAEYQDSIGNSDAADTLGDWADTINAVNETAMSGWENLKSGNVMGAISDAISMPFKLLATLNKIHDKDIEKNIQKHAEAVNDLERAYAQLERAVEKSLGDDVYKKQKASIDNMKQQRLELLQMADDERSKKKGDESKAKEYEAQVEALGNAIEDMMDDMVSSIISTDAKAIADQLGNAFITAFSKGENAAQAWGNSVNEIVSKIARNMLIQELLQKPIGSVLDKYSKEWVDNEGNFKGFGAVTSSIVNFSSELNSLTASFAKDFEKLPEEVKKLFLGTQDSSKVSLSGAIKGASQEEINVLAGYMNSAMISQRDATELIRQQLLHLANIDSNTSKAGRHLESIDGKISNRPYDPSRAQGTDE
ncbi:MAG: hypothetical protein LBJ57_02700 [Prevotellaceae bacterium]|jgi:hypothetical protein|nr:hypothetical protein [Prevotellaceae bacterium]